MIDTDWTDLKRVLVEVQSTEAGFRWDVQMNEAVNLLLKEDYAAALGSHRNYPQTILWAGTKQLAGVCESCNWLPDAFGHCPPQFVLCAPRAWFHESVPDYTGPVKGEKP